MTRLCWAVLPLLPLLARLASALSCTRELQALACLPAFSHSPPSLDKCYCSSRCPDLETIRNTCQSGQLQTDPCGICLQCAPGYGETCGGFGNAAGTCSGGLGCLVRYRPGRETEHNKTGTCVTEQGVECRSPGSGVSCRPGQIGVPADFVFCPSCPRQGAGGAMSTRQSNQRPGFLFSGPGVSDGAGGRGERREEGGSLVALLQGGQGLGTTLLQALPGSLPDSIRESLRESLAGTFQ